MSDTQLFYLLTIQARLAKKSFLFGHLFFNIKSSFAPKNGRDMLVRMPQDGHWLANFEVTPPSPPKVSFFRSQKNEN